MTRLEAGSGEPGRLGRAVDAFDERAEALVAPLRGRPVADRVFYTASALGEFGLLWIGLALLRALRGGKRNERAAARAIGGEVLESILVNAVLKSIVGRRRPLDQVDHPLPFRQPISSSFPSGHATAAFCAAVLLGEDDPLAPAYWGAAAIVAASRLHVRIHHASDVLGGAGLGVLLGRLGRALVPLSPRTARR